jgi:hypothetical protein
MLISASQIVVLAMGIVVSALSLWGLFVPDKMMKLVTGIMDRDWGIHFAVVVRLFLGAALIIAAPRSRFPAIFEIIGSWGEDGCNDSLPGFIACRRQ